MGVKMALDLAKVQYIIFDWDNTLADTHGTLIKTINQVLIEYNLPTWEETSKRLDKNISFKDNFINFFGAKNAKVAYQRYNQIYVSSTIKTVKAISGAEKILDFLYQQGKTLIIVTNKMRNLAELEIQKLFNPHIFAKVVCRNEAPLDKPHPDQAYFALADWLKPNQINPDKVWFIGDSKMDSDCAMAANALPIRIGSPIWQNYIEPLNPKIIYYKDFFELLSVLN